MMNPFGEFLPAGARPRAHAQRIIEQLRVASRDFKINFRRAMTQDEAEYILAQGLIDTPSGMHEWVTDYVRSHFQLASARRER